MQSLTARYFPGLPPAAADRLSAMEGLYLEWNAKINVVSRKDIGHLAVHHILHSLSIAKAVTLKPGTTVLDAGSGGGFPGLPLAVFFPQVHFTLVDSIGKKVRVIESISRELHLNNVTPLNARFESVGGRYDFVTGRAVSGLPVFFSMVKHLVRREECNDLANGILYLTGGEVADELATIRATSHIWPLSGFYSEEYFATKKLVHLSSFR